MNWTVEHINDRPFNWYEEQITSRSLSGYNVYIRNACVDYPSLPEVDKVTYILGANMLAAVEIEVDEDINELPEGLDATDFKDLKVIQRWWNVGVTVAQKDAWKFRAGRLNDRPVKFAFDALPSKLHDNMSKSKYEELLKELLRTDTLNLYKTIQRAIGNQNQRNLAQSQVMMPYSVIIESQMYRALTISSLLLRVLFGEFLEEFNMNELVSQEDSDPYSFHISSKDQMRDLFTVDSDCITTRLDYSDNTTTYLTSMCILHNNNGISFKCYGWEENKNTIKWIFKVSATETKMIDMKRPTREYCSKYANKLLKYSFKGCITEEYVMVQYNPVFIYVSEKNITNFKLLASKLVIDKDGSVNDSKSS